VNSLIVDKNCDHTFLRFCLTIHMILI